MSRRWAVLALALVPAAPAAAEAPDYVARTLEQPVTSGLAVTGPLSDMRFTATARVLVPTSWRVTGRPAGGLRTQSGTRVCRYTTTFSVRAVAAPEGEPAARVTAALPAATPRHVLDSGVRTGRAWRVVRRSAADRRVHVDGVWTTVLTRRADVAPAGQVVWADVRVAAVSRAGDECHAGTWRDALGPGIADALAVTRARKRFTRR